MECAQSVGPAVISHRKGRKSINVPLQINGQSFTFRLCIRQLDFGLNNPIQCYWIRHESLLEKSNDRELSQCSSVSEFWRHAMIERGRWGSNEQSVEYLLASCFQVLCKNK